MNDHKLKELKEFEIWMEQYHKAYHLMSGIFRMKPTFKSCTLEVSEEIIYTISCTHDKHSEFTDTPLDFLCVYTDKGCHCFVWAGNMCKRATTEHIFANFSHHVFIPAEQ